VLNDNAREDIVKVEKAPKPSKIEQLSKAEASAPPVEKRNEKAVSESTADAELPAKKVKKEKIVAPNPLENIKLIVIFKDGNKIEYSMSEVTKVGVDKGILTINLKTGGNARYSILAVAKMTIE